MPFIRSTVSLPLALLALAFVAGCAVKSGPVGGGPGPAADAQLRQSLPSAPEGLLDGDLPPAIARGWELLRGGRYQRAAEHFTGALSDRAVEGRQRAAGSTGLGFALIGQGRPLDAGAAFEDALAAAPGYDPARLGRALLLRREGRWEESLSLYRELSRNRPQSALLQVETEAARLEGLQLLLRRGEAAARTDPGDAVIIYRQALELGPELSQLHGLLAGVLEAAGRHDEAITELERAVEHAPASEQAPYRSRLAWLELEHGDPVRAVAHFSLLLEEDPDSADLRRGLSRAEKRSRIESLPGEYRSMLAGARPLNRAGLAAVLTTTCGWEGRQGMAGDRRPAVIRDIAAHWSADYVRAVVDRGVMDVFQNHTFRPEQAVNRGDLALAACRMLGGKTPPAPERSSTVSTDIGRNHRLYDCVVRLAGAGLLHTGEDGVLRVNEPVGAAEALEVITAVQRLAAGARAEPAPGVVRDP